MTKQFKPTKTGLRQKFLADMNRKWQRKYKQQSWMKELDSHDDIELPKALRGLIY